MFKFVQKCFDAFFYAPGVAGMLSPCSSSSTGAGRRREEIRRSKRGTRTRHRRTPRRCEIRKVNQQ